MGLKIDWLSVLFSLTIKIPKMRLTSLVFFCNYFLPFFKHMSPWFCKSKVCMLASLNNQGQLIAEIADKFYETQNDGSDPLANEH